MLESWRGYSGKLDYGSSITYGGMEPRHHLIMLEKDIISKNFAYRQAWVVIEPISIYFFA